MVDWYPAPVSGCLRRCGKRFRPAGVLCRPRTGDETLSARVEDAAIQRPGLQGTLGNKNSGWSREPAGLSRLPRAVAGKRIGS